MKSQNYYWEEIAKKLGVETTGMKSINYYLKKIYEKLGGDEDKHKSNFFYLRYIADNIDSGGSSCDVEIDWSINGYFPLLVTSITIPNSITTLISGFCGNLSNLESIELPNQLTTIENSCFQGNNKLKEINIPQSVIEIGYNTFPNQNQAELEQVILNWTENPVAYTNNKMQLPNNGKAVFSIPKGTTALYESANYPSEKLVEREE